MLVQLKVGNVSTWTHRAFEVFDVVVVLLMNCQSVAIAESLIANVALVVLLCLVQGLKMSQKFRSSLEHLTALIASESSLELIVVELNAWNNNFRLLFLDC